MTTIAVRDGVMACDSLAIDGSTRIMCEKIYRMPDGTILGGAGSSAAIEAFLTARRKGESCTLTEEDRKSFVVAVLHPDGSIMRWEDERCGWKVLDGFHAIGSGAQAAMAAMHMGADAVKAVEIAKLVNADTGGPVVSMSIAEQS